MSRVAVGTIFPDPGDWCFAPDEAKPERIVLGIPGIGTVRLKITRDLGPRPDGPVWGWNGDLDRPTLEPSINTTSDTHNWHGFLTDGRLRGDLAELPGKGKGS